MKRIFPRESTATLEGSASTPYRWATLIVGIQQNRER